MRNFFYRITSAMARFMYGRNGTDQLNLALLVVYLIICVLQMVLARIKAAMVILNLLAIALAALVLFRVFSRNLARRRAENAKFLELIGPVQRWFHLRRTIYKDKEHCYFKCPHCGQQLRVPRGKGKITVTCRACGASFEEKS